MHENSLKITLKLFVSRKRFILGLFLMCLFFSSISTLQAFTTQKTKDGEILIPVQEPIFVVIKGMFDSKAEAEKTRAFIQQLLVKTQADGIIESEKLEGFPPHKWLIASAFDSEDRAQWWLMFGDRNPKLPKASVKKTRLLQSTQEIPYFPDPVREDEKRFFSEEDVVLKINQFPDVMALKKKSPIKLVFLAFPRTGKYMYDVEIMKSEKGKFVAYDFISLFAGNLNKYSRSLQETK